MSHGSDATSAQREQWTALRGSSHPPDSFTRVFTTGRDLIFKELSHLLGVGTRLKRKISLQVDFRDITYDVYQCSFRDRFAKVMVNRTVTAWCTSVNHILSGKHKETTQTLDTIHQAAHEYYTKKHRHLKGV